MHNVQNTLYVMTPGAYAHLENATIRIDVEREKRLQVPLHHLSAMVCFGNVMVSPALIHRFADEGKSMVFLDDHGRFKARLEGPVSGNVLLRQAQHHAASDPSIALQLARAFVGGKLKNSRAVLQRGARETDCEDDVAVLTRATENLAASLRAASVASDLDTLRGVEGEAARGYFEAINLVVKPLYRTAFRLDGRTRRPPRDRFNALLSFLYAMLMNDCRGALEAVGLDPQIGFLHSIRPGRAALALDLQEEFRAVMCDRFALTLINRGQVSEKDFETREGGAVLLGDAGRRAVVSAWQERKREEVTHPVLEQKFPVGLLPLVQARILARVLRGDVAGYVPYVPR